MSLRYLTAAALIAAASPAAADYRLHVLHINDLHSRIEPITKYNGTCGAEDDAAGKCFGGVARVKTYLDGRQRDLRTTGANVITLDAGDQFQGSLFYSTYKGTAAAEFANQMGFDAMAVGNHEFDDGPEKLRSFIDAVDFPVISGNTSTYSEPLLKGRVPGYVILTIGGQKIGVVSVLATDTAETSSPGPNVGFGDEIRYLQSIVPEIESQGANKIIALTHVGLNKDMEIATAVPGIDLVVGGHSHTYLSASDPKRKGAYPTWVTNTEGTLVPVVQAYAYSKYVGELTVDFDDDGNLLFAEGDAHLLDASVKPNAAMAARVAELAAPIEELKAKLVGEVAADIDGDRGNCRSKECTMGVLVAEAVKDKTAADIVIVNGGGLRASIAAGQVTMGDVLTVLPFQNTVATFKLSGADVIAALENGVSQIEDLKGRFPQVSGLRFAFDPTEAPGSRVTQVQVPEGDGWADIDPDHIYSLASNDYMRSGGDGYKIFATNGIDAYDYGPGLEQVVADYIAANSPYTPGLRGNIVQGDGFTAEAPASAPAAATDSGKTYTVKQGDNFWDIAREQLGGGAQWEVLAAANGMTGDEILQPGMVLKLP
ncbi:MAG: 5'-nucleotidase C-terminal domain-containing protein [Pikeienuella sp.]